MQANNGFVQKSKSWLIAHKTIALIVLAVLLVGIILAIVLPLTVGNIFRANRVAKIKIGDDYARVEEILGKPFEAKSNKSVYTYYSNNMQKKLTRLETLTGKQKAQLQAEIDALKHKTITVTFSAGKVSGVVLDKRAQNNSTEVEKRQKRLELVPSQIFADLTPQETLLYARIYYKDGSYKLDRVRGMGISGDQSSGWKLKWSDAWGSYASDITTGQIAADTVVAGVQDDFSFILYPIFSDGGFESFRMVIDGEGEIAERATYTWTRFLYDVTELEIGDGVTGVPSNLIKISGEEENWLLKKISIGSSLTDIGKNTFNICTNLDSIEVDSDNTRYAGTGNCLVDKETKTLILGCRNSEIPNDGSVKNIGARAFYYCDGLTSLTIPASVTSIDGNAFRHCTGLNSIQVASDNARFSDAGNCLVDLETKTLLLGCKNSVIPTDGSVVNIADNAFESVALTNVTLPDSLVSIGSKAFWGCDGLTSVVIPENVTRIGDWAFSCCDNVTSVTVGTGVKSVGYGAFESCHKLATVKWNATNCQTAGNDVWTVFADCPSLTSAQFGNNVQTIPNYLLYNCNKISTLSIPASVTSIGAYAFGYCTNLSVIEVASNNTRFSGAGNCLVNLAIKTLIAGCKNSVIPSDGSVVNIADSAFESVGLTSVTIPNSVVKIGAKAFWGCRGLTQLTMGNRVESIGDWAFSCCDSLTGVTVPESVRIVGYGAFENCGNLATVHWNAANCQTAGDNLGTVFSHCPKFTTLQLGNNVQSIPSYLFYNCGNITSLSIPASLTSIGESAFSYCSGLARIEVASNNSRYYGAGNCLIDKATKTLILGCQNSVIPNDGSVTKIGDGAFERCVNLTSIIIPDSIVSIGTKAFWNCNGLTEVTIGKGVASLGNWAFSCCNNLTTVTISESVWGIGYGTFEGSYNLTTVYWNATNCAVVGNNYGPIFLNCFSLSTVVFGDNVQSVPEYAFYRCGNLTNLTLNNGLKRIGTFAFRDCSSLTSVTIPESVVTIDDSAFFGCNKLSTVYWNATNCQKAGGYVSPIFAGCSALTTLVLGEGVQSVTDYAFYGCSKITSVTIPESVTSIKTYAFYGCSSLASLEIPNGVTSIGDGAFYNCSNLTSVTIPASVTSIGDYLFRNCRSLTDVTLPSGVTSIGEEAFYGCSSLTSLTIPAKVNSIGKNAFYGCSNLTAVTFENTAGWTCSSSSVTAAIDSSALSKAATAAQYLTGDYRNYTWTRS